jgi:lipopolysaccharide transport system ATP-binding protein
MPPQSASNVVISVENLGKCYRIYDRPKDRLKQAFWRSRRQYFREFWALRNVSF